MASVVANASLGRPVLQPIRATFDPFGKDVFVIKGKSMLDAVFIRRARLDLRRPEYITTTLDSTTVLWRVSHRGHLHRLAEFCWESGVSTSRKRLKRDGMVIRRDGVDHPAEFYGSRRSPSSRNASFSVGDCEYQWRLTNSGHQATASSALTQVNIWKCTTIVDPSSKHDKIDRDKAWNTPSGSNASIGHPEECAHRRSRLGLIGNLFKHRETQHKRVISRLIPPHHSLVQGEMAIDRSMASETATLLISAILLASSKNDWKYSQSRLPPSKIEATLISDLAGDLPQYTDDRTVNGHLHTTVSSSSRWRWSGTPHNRLAPNHPPYNHRHPL
ncbi:hypothetical protein FRC16_004640 [Serendipita sp. 398]|nr:hypothetical protein FRC16_004640 [Serendipita sp. 398]